MQTVKNNADIAELLVQIADSSAKQLPTLHIPLRRTLNWRVVFYAFFAAFWCFVALRAIMLADIWVMSIFLLPCMAVSYVIYRRILAFKPSLDRNANDYCLILTPQYFEVYFKDTAKRTRWRDIHTITHRSDIRYSLDAGILIYLERRANIEIFHPNIQPMHHKKLCELIHDYWLVANGRRVIKIK